MLLSKVNNKRSCNWAVTCPDHCRSLGRFVLISILIAKSVRLTYNAVIVIDLMSY